MQMHSISHRQSDGTGRQRAWSCWPVAAAAAAAAADTLLFCRPLAAADWSGRPAGEHSGGTMGNTFRKMFDSLFGSREMRVVMLGERCPYSIAACDRTAPTLEMAASSLVQG